MSAIDNGSRNSAVLAEKRQPQLAVTPTPAQVNRTLLDIIRDEESSGGSLFGHSNKKSWKAFRDRIRIRRAGSAWTSSIHVPTSDIPIRHHRNRHHSLMSKKNSVRFTTVSTLNTGETAPLDDDGSPPAPASAMASSSASRPIMMRRSSTRFAVSGGSESDDHAVEDVLPVRSFRPQLSRHNSTRFPGAGQDPDGINDSPRKLFVALADERAMSAREAVAAQEAAEAAAAQAAAGEEDKENDEEDDDDDEGESPGGEGGPVRMSLMDLLEETDRQMGLEGSKYTVGDDDGDAEDDGDYDDEGPDDGVEHTCCVCMVRHKGSAFIPCGHTFCRLCSRELWVQRGNCPLCNGFILEILDIF